MDFISQGVRIALGLVVVLTAGILLAPAQPTLLAARPEMASQPTAPDPAAPGPIAEAEPEPEPTVSPPPALPAIDPEMPETAAVPEVAEEPLAGGSPTDDAASDEAEAADEPAPAAEPREPSLAELTAEPPPLDFRLFRSPDVSTATTLRADGRDIRLAGLDALPANARCASGAACGEAARQAVSRYLAGRSILCSVAVGRGDASEVTAPCLAGEDDIGAWVVRNGWADAGPGSRYEDAAAEARSARRGIWAEGGPLVGD